MYCKEVLFLKKELFLDKFREYNLEWCYNKVKSIYE